MVAQKFFASALFFTLCFTILIDQRPSPGSSEPLRLVVAEEQPAVTGWPSAGTCILHGGGSFTGEEISELRRGGSALVYICSNELPLSEEERRSRTKDWGARGFESIDFIHVSSREQAFDSELVDRIDLVGAMFVSGGKQEYLTHYTNSPVVDATRRLLERGGVLMGSSAGTAIFGKRAILKRRIDDSGNVVLVEEDGWNILPDLISDQHLLTKDRAEHLPMLLEKYPCEGIGIDDETAVIIRFSKREPTFTVVGNSEAHYFHRPSMSEKAKVIKIRKGSAPLTLAFSH